MTTTSQITTPRFSIRRSNERGKTDIGWLKSRHTFSFGDYDDPAHRSFRALRVINDDWVAPGKGFGMHPHRDMEIVSYVLAGAIEHRDSTGGHSTLRPGTVQRMTAGTGIMHSEFNPSREESLHLMQIWIEPSKRGLAPGYEERSFSPEETHNRLRLIASPDGREGSLTIHQDARIHAAILDPGRKVELDIAQGRFGWIQIGRGTVELDGTRLEEGDAASLTGGSPLALSAVDAAEVLIFDLA